MLWLFEKLKEEQRVISAARWSFLTACIAVTVFIWGGFDYFYRGKLADSDRHANQWKSDAEYWKDVAEHPKKAEITGNAQQPLVEPQGRPKQTKQKKSPIVLPPGTSITATTAAPDSAAVGINTGTVTVNPPVNPLAPKVYYDFAGAKHTITGNRSEAEAGEQTTRFQEMANLEKSGKWEELRQAAEVQISAVPTWLTPYLFAAEANAKLGNKSKAIELCEFVKQKSGGNLDFDRPANALLGSVK